MTLRRERPWMALSLAGGFQPSFAFPADDLLMTDRDREGDGKGEGEGESEIYLDSFGRPLPSWNPPRPPSLSLPLPPPPPMTWAAEHSTSSELLTLGAGFRDQPSAQQQVQVQEQEQEQLPYFDHLKHQKEQERLTTEQRSLSTLNAPVPIRTVAVGAGARTRAGSRVKITPVAVVGPVLEPALEPESVPAEEEAEAWKFSGAILSKFGAW